MTFTASINANLFRVASSFISSEETRYYLRGVFVEPHQSGVGVYLIATDGHRMFVSHDETGSCEGSAIVSLDKAALSACKANRNDNVDRVISIADGNATILLDDAPVAAAFGVIVDGTFPDWRRIAAPNLETQSPATFCGRYVSDFAKAAQELTGQKDAGLRIVDVADGPCLVRFDGVENAYGVLMPKRAKDPACAVPFFLNAPSADELAASKARFAEAAE